MNHWLRFLFYFAHVFLIAGCLESGPADDDDVLMTHAQAIHSAVITLDSHDDIPYDFATPAVDPLNADRQLTLEKNARGRLGCRILHRLRSSN